MIPRGRILLAAGLIGALLWADTALAQRQAPAFAHLTVDNGLSQNFVTAIAQDRSGFIWVGTKYGGLNRYDGYQFTSYNRRPGDPASLSGSEVTALAVDTTGILWVGTSAGLNAYDPRTDAFVRRRVRPVEADPVRVTAIHCDRAGRLWVGSSAGLDRLEPGATAFTSVRAAADGDATPLGEVRRIREDAAGTLLVGGSAGLAAMVAGRLVPVALRTAPGVAAVIDVLDFAVDGANDIWIAAARGRPLHAAWGARARTVPPESASVDVPIVEIGGLRPRGRVVEATGANTIWFGGYYGADIYHPTDGAVVAVSSGRGDRRAIGGAATALLVDQAGTVWVGTNGSGLARTSTAQERFAHIVPPGNNPSVRAIAQDAAGDLWIGGYSGLTRYRSEADGIFSPLARQPGLRASAYSLFQDPQRPDVLWVGSGARGLLAYDQRRDTAVAFGDPPGVPARSSFRLVLSIYRDSGGTLWAGTAGGLCRVDEASRTLRLVPLAGGAASEGEPAVTAITERRGAPGWLWIATDKGLFLLESASGQTQHLPGARGDAGAVERSGFFSILEGRDGAVWLGSPLGLHRALFDGEARLPTGFRRYLTADGLPDDCVYGMLEDADGHIWLSTNRGLSRLAPESMTFRNYSPSDGLQSVEFNSGASYRAADGRMYFGGINGVSAFWPANVHDSTYHPPVVITQVQVLNRRRDGGDRTPRLDAAAPLAESVRLSPDDKVVAFEFAALDYTAPERNRYACMMKGFDDGWLDLGTQRRVTYTNLPSGSHTFLVRATNSDGVWNPSPASLSVIVVPPWWATWWTRLLAATGLTLAMYTAHRRRTVAIRRRNRTLREEVDRRRRTEQALVSAEARYRTIVDGALVGIYQSTPDGRYASVNPALATMLGYDSPEQLVATVTDIGTQVYADAQDRRNIAEQLRAEGQVRGVSCQFKRRDGSTIAVLLTARLVVGVEGEPYYEGVVEDVTERRQLESQLVHAQKMDSIGRLAGGIAHDFNNMLTVIQGYTDLALEESHGSAAEEFLKHIATASATAKDLTSQLLAFSRRQVARPAVVSPAALLVRVEPLLRQLLGEDIALSVDLPEDTGHILIDPNQFEQILMNLAANARDAMPSGGVVQVDTANVMLDAAYARQHESVRPGAHVLVVVRDTGVGIPQDVLSRVFEPFFTTKELGKGTGLGLATVYGIVKQHGGHIWVYSEVGKGTTVKMCFPRVAGTEAGLPACATTVGTRGSETVLVVEDEPLVRNFAATALRAAGYEVLTAPDGFTALDIVRGRHPPLDLVLTDVVMPGMSGKALAQEVERLSPSTAILYASGFSEDVIVHRGVLTPGIEFLQKPYGPRDVAARVRELLDRRAQDRAATAGRG